MKHKIIMIKPSFIVSKIEPNMPKKIYLYDDLFFETKKEIKQYIKDNYEISK